MSRIATTSPTASPAHRQRPSDEAEPVPRTPTRNPTNAADGRTGRRGRPRRGAFIRCGASSRRDGEEPGVRDHPVVGADRLAVDVPAALEHLERLGHAERRLGELLAQRRTTWQDRREVRQQDPAGSQRGLGVLHHLPRLGEVEHDAVEVVDLDALVDVARPRWSSGTSGPRKPSTLRRARSAKSSRSS